ncbi:MAG TPA: lamin tail domain-containing protein [Methanothrix sp.]|nr:lamin tail domain-containing protein [Methanothrix sp.]HPR65859.1 lamin tail domain-containing protein [Methanothrix sp.]
MGMNLNFVILFLALVAAPASADLDKARGTVIAVESGDVFDVQIDEAAPKTGSGMVKVRLAGVSLPPLESIEGKAAKEFSEALLMNRTVWLEIENQSDDGRDSFGRLLCVVYLEDPGGEINLTHPLSRILVDAGHAEVDDSGDVEADLEDWLIWVVINEVEANPLDSDVDNEWVELYNDGFYDADVGNWTLTTAGGSVITIEPGTIVPALGFLVVTADGYWLRNNDELVILRDAEGLEVDRTPLLNDEDDDDYSWSRYPDGGDEWVYIEASPGQPVPPIEFSLGTISDLAEDENWLQWSVGCYPYGLWDVSDFIQ